MHLSTFSRKPGDTQGIRQFLVVFLGLLGSLLGPLAAQDSVTPPIAPSHRDAISRDQLFSMESFDQETQKLSDQLLLKALDSEAFYTLVGQLKPVSEGFWGGYFSVDPADLTEIDQVRKALKSWNVPNIFFADVLVYESTSFGQRYASAYVIHIPSLKNLIERKKEFFARWGITPQTPPAEIMMAIERCRQPEDRWRGFGLVFGYPESAIDFFVAAGMHQRSTGEFVERDFRQIATFANRSGRFVYAVPKLSSPSSEEIALQRRAAVLLAEYKRLRPKYMGPSKKPRELLRDWMADEHGHCHPEHMLAKLPPTTEAEIEAEIASWNVAENKPPEVMLNHLYLVLNQEDFNAVRSSDFLVNQFAASDQGLPKFLPVDETCQAIYLRGSETYLELLGPDNKFGEPVGKFGIGWSVEKVGEIDSVEKILTDESPDTFIRSLSQWDFDREDPVHWYHSLFRKQPALAKAVWWFSEYHVDFIPTLYPGPSINDERIARRDFLASRYDSTKILKNLTSLTMELPNEAAKNLRADLEKLGWTIDSFDARTWTMRGPEFRILLTLAKENETARLKSIGFATQPQPAAISPMFIGPHVEVSIGDDKTGWIDFHDP